MESDARLARYCRWFYAAAIYNVLWGTVAILFPVRMFELMRVPPPNYPPLVQSIGMMVLVYGPGYWLVAKNPQRYGAFAWIGLLGKTLGPIGFVYAYATHGLPGEFGLNLVFNDLIWWIPFWGFCLRYAPLREVLKP